jgi:predicted RNase H-like HicB family nuclease
MPRPARHLRYHIHIFHSKDDAGFIADVPDLKYCSAFGDTPEEAVREVQIAMKLWIEAAKERRKRVPKPRHGHENSASAS